jgi:uncharacterized protein
MEAGRMGSSRWRMKDAMTVLFINLIAGFIVVDFLLKPALLGMGMDSLEAGTLGGIFLASIAFATVYVWGIRKYNISWKVIGVFNAQRIYQHKKIIFLYTLSALAVSLIILFVMYTLIGVSPNDRSHAVDEMKVSGILLAMLSSVIVSPVYEEILYRGFLYPTIRNTFGIKKAILLSSLIFSLVHLPSLDILPVNFINGIVFALLYERTNSIYVPIIAHALFNFCLITLVYLFS